MTTNVRSQLSTKQLQAVALLAEIPSTYSTMKDVAKKVGVDERTLRRWRNLHTFQEAQKKEISQNYLSYGVHVRSGIVKAAVEGNAAMAKLYLQHAEGWGEKSFNNNNGYEFMLVEYSEKTTNKE